MFKLVKINGSKTNVPEITTFNIDGTTPYKAGALYFINDGTLSTEQAFYALVALDRMEQGKTSLYSMK